MRIDCPQYKTTLIQTQTLRKYVYRQQTPTHRRLRVLNDISFNPEMVEVFKRFVLILTLQRIIELCSRNSRKYRLRGNIALTFQ